MFQLVTSRYDCSQQNRTMQETQRLTEDRERRTYWKRWGPYLSERQWGTVYPYEDLVQENIRRLDSPRRGGLEYELIDTGIFDHDRYFDVFVEYAKASPEDILIQISIPNRGPDLAPVHLLPTLGRHGEIPNRSPLARVYSLP